LMGSTLWLMLVSLVCRDLIRELGLLNWSLLRRREHLQTNAVAEQGAYVKVLHTDCGAVLKTPLAFRIYRPK